MDPGRTLAALIVAALVLLSARDAPPTAGFADALPAQAYAGAISIATDAFPDGTGLGGAFGFSLVDNAVSAPLIDAPLAVDNHGQLFGDLATVVPSTSNGGIKVVHGNEVITVHLKPNQRWSDGTPITPQDYVIGYVLALAPEVGLEQDVDPVRGFSFSGHDMIITYKGIYGPALYGNIPGPLPFEYFNKKYHTTVPASLVSSYDFAKDTALVSGASYRGSALQRMVKAWLNDRYDSPSDVFNGPYQLQAWVDQQRVVEVPNPYYTALPPDAHHPRPASLAFVVVTPNASAYPLAMTTQAAYNTFDLAIHFGPSDLSTLRHTEFKIAITAGLNYWVLLLNQAVPALADVRVRQALTFAIDRFAFAKALFAGVSLDAPTIRLLAQASPLGRASPYYDASIPLNPYNPARAKTLLAAAGYATSPGGRGKHLVLTCTLLPTLENFHSARLLQHFWAQVGIDVRIQSSDSNRMVASYRDGGLIARRTFQMVYLGWATLFEPDQLMASVDPTLIPDASHPLGTNYSGIDDPMLVDLILKARHTLDEGQRHRLWDQIQERFVRRAYWIFAYAHPPIDLVKPTLGNFKQSPFLFGATWNAFQWYRAGP